MGINLVERKILSMTRDTKVYELYFLPDTRFASLISNEGSR